MITALSMLIIAACCFTAFILLKNYYKAIIETVVKAFSGEKPKSRTISRFEVNREGCDALAWLHHQEAANELREEKREEFIRKRFNLPPPQEQIEQKTPFTIDKLFTFEFYKKHSVEVAFFVTVTAVALIIKYAGVM